MKRTSAGFMGDEECPKLAVALIFSFSRDGLFSKIFKNSSVNCCSSSAVTVASTYEYHSFFSFDSGISQLDHLHATNMQKHATTLGLYCIHIVVRCKLFTNGN